MAEKPVPYSITPERLAWYAAHPEVLPNWEERVAIRELLWRREWDNLIAGEIDERIPQHR